MKWYTVAYLTANRYFVHADCRNILFSPLANYKSRYYITVIPIEFNRLSVESKKCTTKTFTYFWRALCFLAPL